MRKFGATCVAAGIYFTLPFVPTRLNTADDPTRDREVRQAWSIPRLGGLSNEDIQCLRSLPKLRRWASNWVRLVCGLYGFHGLEVFSQTGRLHGLPWLPVPRSSSLPAAYSPPGSTRLLFDLLNCCDFCGFNLRYL